MHMQCGQMGEFLANLFAPPGRQGSWLSWEKFRIIFAGSALYKDFK